MKYKIIFLDIDGTLTDSRKLITEKTRKALMSAAEQGLIIAIASGRPEPGLAYAAGELELSNIGGYILPFNGGLIKDALTGEVISSNTISREALETAYKTAKEFGIGIITYKDGDIIAADKKDEYIELESRINGMPVNVTDRFLEEIDFAPVKCLLTGEPAAAEKAEKRLAELLSGKANVFRSESFFVEVVPNGIDKAESIKTLIGRLGISREEVIACGDGFNDVSMISYAGLGVCMSNGCDAAKAAADYIAPSNDEDGIAEVIEKFVL
ncbi:MAG: Cof-type HAD-IIB family hydrolase [Oscillospiraceae bacterium]|nr:Cof-type HAD-IIB family hydrolase [Oscillospiraceae bacterium]MDY6208864.1 Cof-type HAD-IIB family hydrolase [Oscillospiraceae bacterium]